MYQETTLLLTPIIASYVYPAGGESGILPNWSPILDLSPTNFDSSGLSNFATTPPPPPLPPLKEERKHLLVANITTSRITVI